MVDTLKKSRYFATLVPMDPRDRKIEELLKLVEENNDMLHKMRRSMRIATVLRVIYWCILAGAAVGTYYLVQPYVEGAQNIYTNIDHKLTAVDDEFQDNLNSFLNLFKSSEDARAQ